MTHHRICIIGNSGSGKSTLAKALGEKLKLPVFHLDREMLTGNFEKLPSDKYQKAHADLIEKEDWVIDGNYKKAIPARLKRATLVVFLDVSRLVTVPRLMRRTYGVGQMAESVPEGARRESLSLKHLKWTTTYSRWERRRNLDQLTRLAGVPLLVLKNASTKKWVEEITTFLKQVS